MKNNFQFTFAKLEEHFGEILKNGYKVITCRDYIDYKKNKQDYKIFVNRVDVDKSIRKAKRVAEIFNKLDIKGSFFIRLHADEYNPFSFENYKILKYIIESGHEIGYHSEVIDESVIWGEDAVECLKRDIEFINSLLGIKIKGISSHHGFTGLNNLDFWKERKAADFGLLYETYDTQPDFDLFNNSFYVSDSNWFYWKCYNKGILVENDRRNPGEHARDNHKVIYSLIHPETYYDSHFYE